MLVGGWDQPRRSETLLPCRLGATRPNAVHENSCFWWVIGYTYQMIRSFRHRGLKRLFENGDRSKVRADQVDKVERILARLTRAAEPDDMNLPGYRLHKLKGGLAGFWAVSVSGNWRIVWRFDGRDAADVDLIDYH
jgi:proteic killer suppression protein